MDYILKRDNRSASIRIRINDAGLVVVSAPKLVPSFLIEGFVKKQHDWIARQQQRLQLRKVANPTLDWNEKVLSYQGQLYSIKVISDGGKKVTLLNDICLIRPITGAVADAKRTLLVWLKQQAAHYIQERVVYWSQVMQVEVGTVRFGQQSSRWGSCSGDNNLRFNWRLIHFSNRVIDYVVIHELAHIIHHDHSRAFWHVVHSFCPDWQEQRAFLRRQSLSVEKI